MPPRLIAVNEYVFMLSFEHEFMFKYSLDKKSQIHKVKELPVYGSSSTSPRAEPHPRSPRRGQKLQRRVHVPHKSDEDRESQDGSRKGFPQVLSRLATASSTPTPIAIAHMRWG